MRTYEALYIAKKVISKTDIEQGDSITNLKLQKLLYYLQGFWLAYFDTPLFEDEIQAWMYGPVVPTVYQEYKRYGKSAIDISEDNDPYANEYPLETEDEETFFDEVYTLYNQYSATALVRMTHNETPWAIATKEGLRTTIDREVMKRFFKTKLA